ADRTKVGERRLRSTVAHEIGHGLLHEGMFVQKISHDHFQMLLFGDIERKQAPPPTTQIATRPNTIDHSDRPFEWWEFQANRCMAELLMPRPLFLQVVGSHIDPEKVLAEVPDWEISTA